MELDNLKDAARARRRETEVMFQAYSATLSALRPANFLLVVGAALLSLVAGAASPDRERLSDQDPGWCAGPGE